MVAVSTAEKIETIILCYLKNGTTAGAWGTLEKLARGYRVTADGKTVVAFTVRNGWQVNCAGGQAVDVDLLEAVRAAIA